MTAVEFTNNYFPALTIGEKYLVDEYRPRRYAGGLDAVRSVRIALSEPIGCAKISLSVRKSDKVLILIDDKTRATPVKAVLPPVLAELKAIANDRITIMAAPGTHRAMSGEELAERVGGDIYSSFKVLSHRWDKKEDLINLGVTDGGVPVWLNKMATEADYIIGVGHIVPHRVAGYSGGAKLVLPGISGAESTGGTHWLSAYYSAEEMLGRPDNPVRKEIEKAAGRVKFKFIVNVVQDSAGEVAGVFAGHPVKAHRAGCEFSESIYGVALKARADIVFTEAYPTESELWVATKALQAADIAVKPGGVIVLLAECPDGVSTSYGATIQKYGFMPLDKVERLIKTGKITDFNMASYLARVGNVLKRNKTILVSRGISPEQGEKLGFIVCDSPDKAWEKALAMTGGRPRVAVLHQGSELLPILPKTVEG